MLFFCFVLLKNDTPRIAVKAPKIRNSCLDRLYMLLIGGGVFTYIGIFFFSFPLVQAVLNRVLIERPDVGGYLPHYYVCSTCHGQPQQPITALRKLIRWRYEWDGCNSSKKRARSAAGSWPGADAFPAVPKVAQEPKMLPQTRLTAPWAPMDMVITGVSGYISRIVRVASSSVSTSRLHFGITAYFATSAPSFCMRRMVSTMVSLSGVEQKLWQEAITRTSAS